MLWVEKMAVPMGLRKFFANIITTKRIVPMGLRQNPVVVYGRILITKHLKLTRMPYGTFCVTSVNYLDLQIILILFSDYNENFN